MNKGSDIKREATKGVFWGGFFSLSRQILGLLFGIIIARILMPSDFGKVAMLSIFASLATAFQESGFVYVLTNKKDVSRSDYSTVFWFNITISFVIYIILFVSSPYIAYFYHEPILENLSKIVFLGFFISSFGIVQNAHMFKNMKVFEKGLIDVLSLVVSGIVGYLLAIKGFGFWGIALQNLTSISVLTLLLWIYSPFRPIFVFDLNFIKSSIADCFRFTFPNILSIISENFYSVLLGKYFSSNDVGIYNQATKLNTAGYSSVLGTLRNISQPILVKVGSNSEELLSAFRKIVRLSAFLSVPILLCLSLVSHELVIAILTEKWMGVAPVLQILCVGSIFMNISIIYSYLIMSQNKSYIYMVMGVIISLTKIVLLLLSMLGGNVIWIAFASAFSDIMCFFIYYLIVKRLFRYNLSLFLNDIIPILISSSIAYLSAFVITKQLYNVYSLLVVRIILFSGIYLTASYFFKIDIMKDLRNVFLSKVHLIWKQKANKDDM